MGRCSVFYSSRKETSGRLFGEQNAFINIMKLYSTLFVFTYVHSERNANIANV